LVSGIAAVTHIEFSQAVPHEFAVTSGTRVQIYDPVSNEVSKTVSRFKETVYSGTFRRDGRLLAACVGKQVNVVNMSTRTILRQFRGHEALTTCARFHESAGQLLSGSNDRTVRVWDVATEQEVCVLRGHEDYVLGLAGMHGGGGGVAAEAGVTDGHAQHLWASVSADRTCRLWDLRAKSDRAQMVLEHDGRIVRSALFTEDARLLCTGGEGGLVRIWDLMAGGRVQTDLVAHQKDVTALQLYKDPSSGRTRLLSAGLDHHVKIYDMSSHRVSHTIKYPSQIMSFAISVG
jgi:U3 small nucleolar RNA-associated protein 15